MTSPCSCAHRHTLRRVVLTGGPGAGKTAVLELLRQAACRHVRILPESAGILFAGGFPRGKEPAQRRASQRAIFHVQRELETAFEVDDSAVLLCDRGTVDGIAYWPGPGDFWGSVKTTREDELARYHAVIHLRVPSADQGYNHTNPLRIESAEEARAIDDRIAEAWAGHPHYHVVPPSEAFLTKASAAMRFLRTDIPDCCSAALRAP